MTDTPSQFAIIPIHGPPPADAIIHGSLSVVMEQLPDTQARQAAIEHMYRVAADAVEAEERRQAAHDATMRMVADAVTHFVNRMDRIIRRYEDEARHDAEREEQARQDEQAERITAALDALRHHNTGDLSPLPPVDQPQYEDPDDPDNEEPEDEPEDRDDTLLPRHTPGQSTARDQGNLPRDLTSATPPGGDANYPTNSLAELDKPPDPPQQPVAVSLW
jgi:hypothetical protein